MKPWRLVHLFNCAVCWRPVMLASADAELPTCTKYGDQHEGFVSKAYVRRARERAVEDESAVYLVYTQSEFAPWFGLPRRKTGAELQEALARNKRLLGRSDILF